MKQTNNAIKFLMAQYRAIFKHAYLKGLASAVILTTALAAGAAPTVANGTSLNADNWDDAFNNATVTITGQETSDGTSGNYQFIQFSGNKTLSEGQTLKITAGNQDSFKENFIKASGSAATTTISGEGTLLLDAPGDNGTAYGLAIYASGTNGTTTTVDIDTVTMNEGDIQLDATSGATTKLIANTFNVGNGVDNGNGTRSCIYLGITNADANASGGTVQLGDEKSIFNVKSDGRLIFGGVSGSRSITADSITLDGGRLSSEGNASTSTNTVQTHTLTLQSGAGFSVGSGSGSITLSFINKGSEEGYGFVDETSEISLASTLTLNSGNLTIADGAKLYSDADAGAVGTLAISGSSASVTIYSTTLNGLLNGLKDVKESKSGSVSLTNSGTLVLADTGAVDLADFTFGDGSGAAGTIVASGGKIAGNNLAVSKELKGTATGLNIKATNLTLGDSSNTLDASDKFGFASATAKNVTFKNSGDALTFNDNLILSSTKTVDGAEVSDNGVIQGPVILSGSMTVNGGKYTNEGTFTLNGGKLEVVNSGTSTVYDESSLKLNKFTIDTSNSGTITVDGKLAGEYDASKTDFNKLTQLDLSDGFELKGTANNASLSVTSGGIVLLKASSVQDSIDTAETNTSSGTLSLSATSGGKLVVDGDLTLDFTSDNASKLKSVLSIGEKGIIEADKITITSTMDSGSGAVSSGNGLGFDKGIIRVDELSLENNGKLSNNNDVDVAYLVGGEFVIGSKLTSSDKVTLANSTYVGSGQSEISLVFKTADASGTGTINAPALVVDSTSGEINVVQGKWTAPSTAIDLNSGTLNIGDTSGSIASLTADSLNSASTVNVNKDSSATFDAFTQTAGTITVKGVLTVNGKHSGSGADESWGVNTSGSTGTIKVTGNAAKLSFGQNAVGNISVSDNKITYANGKDTFAKNIELSGFATLELGLSENISFTEEGLKNLRQEFISGNKGEVLTNGYIDIGDAKIAGVEVSGGKVSWNDLEKISDIIADIKSTEQSTATLTDVSSNDTVNANVGNILADDGVTSVTVGQATLNQANSSGAFITNNAGDILGATVAKDGTLGLYNGGQIGAVSLTAGTNSDNLTTLNVVADNGAETAIKSISAGDNTQVNINGVTKVTEGVNVNNLKVDQALTVAKDVTVSGKLASTEGVNTGSISAQKLNVTGETEYAGNLQISGDASFGDITYLGGNNSFGGDVTFTKGAQLDRGTTTADSIALGQDASLEIVGNASVSTNVIESTSNYAINLVIGEEAGTEAGESWDSSAGYLTAGRIDLNGGTLIIDPEYGKSASIVAVGSFGETNDYTEVKGNEAGNLNGQVIALRNSIVAIGVKDGTDNKALDQVKSTFSRYFDANGSLNEDNVGAIAYVAKALDVDASAGSTSKIVIDSTKSFSTYEKDIASGAYADKVDNNIYLGNNSVLAISDYAALESKDSNGQRAAINFTGGDASLYAEADAKIVLVGDGFSSRDEVMLFSDEGTNEGVLIKGNSVTVETINGLLNFTLEKDKETTGGTLSLNHEAVASSFSQASAPVKYSLIAYAANDNNWAQEGQAGHKADELHGDVVAGVYSDNGTDFYTKSGNDKKYLTDAQSEDYVAINNDDGTFTVYTDGYNSFLDNVVRNSTTGIEAEQAARLAVFGGAAQAALSAGATTYDAISGRMGVGAQTGSITFADNGQGAGLWVTPVYKNHDSDGFGAQGASYGVDMDMYGVALGGDFTLANGLRVGAAFNVGSGDADGQGTGAGVSNDFDYYGFAVYGGFTYDKLSIVGDISYTVVDNDVEANTAVEKLTASMDSANLSVGVTGQYSFDYNGLSIVPHAGLRYTNIDLDDYTVKGSEDVAHFDGDSVNIFSIPVGVTFSKDYTAGDWTIKPAFDLTLTANMGDDSIEGTVAWANISNMSTKVESEVLDDWTYGATLGVSAQSGNFSLGFGVNYTGASSADEYSVGANARFVF